MDNMDIVANMDIVDSIIMGGQRGHDEQDVHIVHHVHAVHHVHVHIVHVVHHVHPVHSPFPGKLTP